MVRRLSAAFFSLLALTCALMSQDAKRPDNAFVIRGDVDYVEVPVIVQRSGKHVTGLKNENFALQQDGKVQQISTFEEVHSSTAVSKTDATAEPVAELPQFRIIAMDTVNTPNLDRAYFEKEFEKYLSSMNTMSAETG